MSLEDSKDTLAPEAFLNPDAASLTGGRADTSYGQASPYIQYAGFWIRAGANLIDGLFLVGISFLLFNPIRRATGYTKDVFSPVDFVEVIFDFLYMILLTWWSGQTLGKMLTGIRVVNARTGGNRGNLTLGQVVMREVLGKFLSSLILGLGYLWVAWSDKKRAWHDMVAKTIVIREKKRGSSR